MNKDTKIAWIIAGGLSLIGIMATIIIATRIPSSSDISDMQSKANNVNPPTGLTQEMLDLINRNFVAGDAAAATQGIANWKARGYKFTGSPSAGYKFA